MTDIKIIKGDEEDSKFIQESLVAFNESKVPPQGETKWEAWCYVAKEQDKILGGVSASWVMGHYLSVHQLWVDENARHHGLGSKLLKHVEDEARNKGGKLCYLDTFDFQAPDFYKKLGYVVFGELEDCPAPGYKRIWMKKAL